MIKLRKLNDNSLIIVLYKKGKSNNIRIADEENGLKIKHIGMESFKEASIKRIVFNKFIEDIGIYAFKESLLEEVVFSNTLSSIRDKAFLCCYYLKKIILPQSLKKIGAEVFKSNISLININIPPKIKIIPVGLFNDCEKLETVIIEGDELISIYRNAFAYCVNLKNINLKEGLLDIGAYAFSFCKALEEINLPKSLKRIGRGIFDNCERLKKVVLPDNITYIPANSFRNCTNLSEVKLGENTIIIEENAFFNCSSLKTIYIPDTVEHIAKNAFQGCNIIIICKKGSKAHEYAKINKISFKLIDKE